MTNVEFKTEDQRTAYTEAQLLIEKAGQESKRHLSLDGLVRKQLEDLSAIPPEISKLTWLTTLQVTGTRVLDLSPISSLPNLKHLDLNASNVTDLTPIANMVNITTLDLRNTNISDLHPIANLRDIEELSLAGNDVVDLIPIAQLTKMKRMTLNALAITDPTPLRHLTALEQLDISHTNIGDLRLILNMPNLGKGLFGGITFKGTRAIAQDATLAELSDIKDDQQRLHRTLAYLRTLPPWPEPLPQTTERQVTATPTSASLLGNLSMAQTVAANAAMQVETITASAPIHGNAHAPLIHSFRTLSLTFGEIATSREFSSQNAHREAALHEKIITLEAQLATLLIELRDRDSRLQAKDDLIHALQVEITKGNSAFQTFKMAGAGAAGVSMVGALTLSLSMGLHMFLGDTHPLVVEYHALMGHAATEECDVGLPADVTSNAPKTSAVPKPRPGA